jgi:hypothetical protein
MAKEHIFKKVFQTVKIDIVNNTIIFVDDNDDEKVLTQSEFQEFLIELGKLKERLNG